MLTYDDCLEKIRMKFQGRPIWNSELLNDGCYEFLLSNDDKIIRGGLCTKTYVINPKTGEIKQRFFGDEFDLSPEERHLHFGSVDGSLRWIDVTPEMVF